MDFPAVLASQLNLDLDTSGGLAASLLELLEEKVRKAHGPDAGDLIGQKVPEMRKWRRSAPTLPPKALSLNHERALSAGRAADFVSILIRHGLDADALDTVAPIVRQFLASRLDQSALDRITAVSGFL